MQIKSLLGRSILDRGRIPALEQMFPPLLFQLSLRAFGYLSSFAIVFTPYAFTFVFLLFRGNFLRLSLRSQLFFLRFSISVYSEPDETKIAQRNFRKLNDKRRFLAHFQTTFPGSALSKQFLSTAYSGKTW